MDFRNKHFRDKKRKKAAVTTVVGTKEEILAKIIHREEPETTFEEIMEAINEEDEKWKEPWIYAALEAMEEYANEKNKQQEELIEKLKRNLKQCVDELYYIHSQYGDKQNARNHSVALEEAESILKETIPD